MVNVGIPGDFIDSQNFNLTNDTDAKTYKQLTDIIVDIDSDVTKHQLTNNTINNVFSLSMISIQGNMWITAPQWAELVLLTIEVNGVRPIKSWELEWIDNSNVLLTTQFKAQMKTLRVIDNGIGNVQLFFRLECTEFINVI